MWFKLNRRRLARIDALITSSPGRVGKPLILAVVGIWCVAAIAGLLALKGWQGSLEIKRDLARAAAVMPAVPKIEYRPADQEKLKAWVLAVQGQYAELQLAVPSRGVVRVEARSLEAFDQFERLVQHVTYGGGAAPGIKRVDVKTMCIGKDCKGRPLRAELEVKDVTISIPSVN